MCKDLWKGKLLIEVEKGAHGTLKKFKKKKQNPLLLQICSSLLDSWLNKLKASLMEMVRLKSGFRTINWDILVRLNFLFLGEQATKTFRKMNKRINRYRYTILGKTCDMQSSC